MSRKFTISEQTKEVIQTFQAIEMFELDFSEIGVDDLVLSQADQTFLTIVTQAICHRNDSHYEIPLPFKDMDMNLPNNKVMALQCLMKHLKRRFKHDEKYRNDYTTIMATVIQNGYTERVPPKETRR